MKARNLFILFIGSYLCLFLVCTILELITVSSTANEILTMVQTAADMALDQVEATDDFFVTGGGYITSGSAGLNTSHGAYKVLAPTVHGLYDRVDLFPTFTGSHDIDEIFERVYVPSAFQSFLTSHPGVLDIGFIGGLFSYGNFIRYDGEAIPMLESTVRWFHIPTVAQLGDSITGTLARDNVRALGTGQLLSRGSSTLTELWKTYDLGDASGELYLHGDRVTYYLTPLSLGVTYLNEELLQVLFMNNMDLLMRSKYATGSYDLNSESCGDGVLKTAFYADLVDADSLDALNPINNGSFTLLRGAQRGSTGINSGVQFFKGIAPKVEYVVLDMYDTVNDAILQQVFGPRLTSGSTTVGAAAVSSRYAGQVVSGSLFKDMDADTIAYYYTMTNARTDILKHKPFVLAKVTFYAEVLVPYTTPLLREMSGRLGSDGTVSARLLFNPFSGSAIGSGVTALAGNYVDVDIAPAVASFTSVELKSVLNAAEVSSLRSGVSGSRVVSYTTYFAVTP